MQNNIKIIIISVVALLISACDNKKISGNGDIKTYSYPVPRFNQLDIAGDFDVEVTTVAGLASNVSIVTDSNLIQYINYATKSNKLEIATNKSNIKPSKRVKIVIIANKIDDVHASGSSYIHVNAFNSDNLVLNLAGAVSFEADNVKVNKIDATTFGSTKLTLTGIANDAVYMLSGASILQAQKLKAFSVSMLTNGSVNASLYASESFEIESNGDGNVIYYGHPKKTSIRSYGSSIIQEVAAEGCAH